jgi:hypothetical protein
MNTLDVLDYGHQMVLQTIDGLPEEAWEAPNVCGVWSTKDILAHLTSFEQVLIDILASLSDSERPTPTLDQFRSQKTFNDEQVALRKDKLPQKVLADYKDAFDQVVSLAKGLPPETFRQNGILPWYGAEYDPDDFIVYTFYGHKREHCAQIKLFRKQQGV